MSGEITTPGALAHERGDLVAERLAATGRHENHRVAARHDVVDDALLLPAELRETEDAMQHVDGSRRGGGHGFTLRRAE